MTVYCIVLASGSRYEPDELVEIHATREGAEAEITRKLAHGNSHARFMVVQPEVVVGAGPSWCLVEIGDGNG